MSTTLMNEEKSIVKINDSDVDLNDLFTMNYNFDILKRVITSVVEQNKSNKIEFAEIHSKLDSKLEEKHKFIQNLETKLNSSIRIINDKIEEKAKDLEEEVRTNRESEDTLNQKIEDLEKKIQDLLKEEKNNKNDRYLIQRHTHNLNKLEDLMEIISNLPGKVTKLEKNVNNLTIKLNEVNIFDALKNANTSGGEDNTDMYLKLIEGIKATTEQKTDFIDNKLDLLQDLTDKMKHDITNSIKKIEHNLDTDIDKTNHIELKIEKLYVLFEELKNFGEENSKRVKNLNNTSSNIVPNKEENEAIINKLKELELKIEELKIAGINMKDNISLNTNNTSVLPVPVIDDSAIKSKLMEIDKNFKIFSLKEKEKENEINKKINELREQIKKKVEVENFHLLTEEVHELSKNLEELKNDHNDTVPRTMEDINWIKKKLETLQNLITNKKTGGGDNSNDLNNMLNDVLHQGKYVESSNFNDYKNLVGKEFNNMKDQMEEFKVLFEDLQLLMNSKADNKRLKDLEGKLELIYSINKI